MALVHPEPSSPFKVGSGSKVPRMLGQRPNEMRISCKRPEKTYVPYRLEERRGSAGPGQPAFVGCMRGLGRRPTAPPCYSIGASLASTCVPSTGHPLPGESTTTPLVSQAA